MSDPLATLYAPLPSKPAWEPPELEYLPARLVVIDYDDPDWYDVEEVTVRVIQYALRTDMLNTELNEGESNLAAYYIADVDGDSVEIKPEWVGKGIYLEVAPSLIDALKDEVQRVCDVYDASPA